jgi:8-oxo-dGTP pyrophosphatase MutT (NUDIX family)
MREKHSEGSYAPGLELTKVAVRARHAASVIVLREEEDGPEVLMGQRGSAASFMPSRLVFPGGRVDPADARAPAAAEPREDTLRHLVKAVNARLARAICVTALRELEEETGLATDPPMRLDALDYLCRAVTPTDQPIRFNARFFVLNSMHVHGAIGGAGELSNVTFLPIPRALAMDIPHITRNVLQVVQEWLALAPELRRQRIGTPLFRGYRNRLTE